MTIIELLIEAKLARNTFHVAAIANGLELGELRTNEERLARARLYRHWREAGEPPALGFKNAIERRAPMKLECGEL